ncbi:tyrosine-type recombinase/integrase [Hymenobacter sp. BT175]|uniref:tyrosine-type recombinase/integrase n=1 Tax=Hymenobacter translucens TaxID=2886507 RepID=UPI001D0E03E7|nr:tyrosine-type recombinase/integrase [Hymenobacter translucens]MCC2546450.1 tyrosine-type recombinase/integrase [Hymenobacter translucens]
MEITRQLRKDKVNKQGYAPIQLTVCWAHKRVREATGERTKPEWWDAELQCVASVKGSYYADINARLNTLKSAVEKAQQAAENEGVRLTEEQVRQIIQQARNPTLPAPEPAPQPDAQPEFWRLLRQWITEYGKKVHPSTFRPISPKTLAGLEATRARLEQFAERQGAVPTLAGMDQDFYHAFRVYVVEELGQELNTFGKHIRRLKAFLLWCEEQDLPVNRRYRKFTAPSLYVGVDALTEQEVRRLQHLDFTAPDVRARLQLLRGGPAKQGRQQLAFEEWVQQIELARDKLLVCVYTGLRISDAEQLSWHHIHGEVIKIQSGKNAEMCYIPYYEDSLFHLPSMAAKYEHRTGLGNDLLLPHCPHLNERLAVLQQLAGITRLHLTSKLGRKTFVTLKLYQGVPTRLVMQATGHKTEESFNRYVGVDTIKLVQEYMRKSPGSHAA